MTCCAKCRYPAQSVILNRLRSFVIRKLSDFQSFKDEIDVTALDTVYYLLDYLKETIQIVTIFPFIGLTSRMC